jgi:hypothetical protein
VELSYKGDVASILTKASPTVVETSLDKDHPFLQSPEWAPLAAIKSKVIHPVPTHGSQLYPIPEYVKGDGGPNREIECPEILAQSRHP